MRYSSEYIGPNPGDYANVLALNSAYLQATSNLKGPQRGRLAVAPFLLFSLHEQDLEWWRIALGDSQQRDLIIAKDLEDSKLQRVQAAALSFLWQLAQRNPYAARVISGATLEWCEQLCDLPLVTLLCRVGARGDLMMSRVEENGALGKRLLGEGLSSNADVRRSTQLSVLQMLLTHSPRHSYAQLPAAACSLSGPLRALHKKV